MALSTAIIKSAIMASMASRGFNPSAGAYGEEYIEAFAEGIYIAITTSATVTDETSTWPVQ